MSNEKNPQVSTAVETEVAPQTLPVPLFSDVEAEAGSTRAPLENDNNCGNEFSPTRQAPKGKPGFGERPAVFRNTFQEVMFALQATIAVATASFLSGTTVVITNYIGSDLNMTQGQISWIGAATTLSAGSFQLALGQLADLLGRKQMFLAGMGSFSAFVLLMAFAQDPFWMDVMCGVLGISAAMVVPPAIGILGSAYSQPSRRKNVAFAAFSAGNPLGFVFGSIITGIATKILNWRAAFIFLCILWAIFTFMGFWAIPKETTAKEPLAVRLPKAARSFDSLGTVLTIFGTGLFTAGLTLGPMEGWKSAQVIAFMAIGVVLLIGFMLWERVWPTPLMPPHIWKDRNFVFLNISVLLGFMSFTSAAFWLGYFLQEYAKMEPLTVALYLLPQAIAGITWNIVAGVILHKVNNTIIMLVGSLAYLAANLLLMYTPSDTSSAGHWYWPFVFPALCLNVVGADFQFNVANMYIMQSFPSEQQSLAGGIFNTLIRLASTVVLGVSTAVYESVKKSEKEAEDPMLKYRRVYLVSVALAATSVVFIPFIRIGTQGNAAHGGSGNEEHGDRTVGGGVLSSDTTAAPPTPVNADSPEKAIRAEQRRMGEQLEGSKEKEG